MSAAPWPAERLVPLADVTTHAILYLRVSKEEQADAGRLSLQTQEQDGRQQIDRLPRTRLLTIYTDMESGRKDDRPQYQAMLEHVRAEVAAGHRVVIVTAALARLGRRMTERVRAWGELRELGVTLYAAREGGEVTELMYNLLASVAQEEVRLLSERISRSNRAYRENGWLRPGGCRWGYRWRPATAAELASGSPSIVLDEDDATAPYVRELFARAVTGESINSLARWTARLPAEARGIGQNGAPRVLSYAGVRQILRAPVYLARHGTFGDDVLDRPAGRWARLVDDADWAAIHGMPWRRRTRAMSDGRYPLTGLLWCSACRAYRMGGRAIKPRLRGGRLTAVRREYACTGHIYGSRCQMVVPAELIEGQMTEHLRRIFDEMAKPEALRRARQIAEREAKDEERRIGGTRMGALRTDLTRTETLLTETWIQSVDGTLTATAFATIQERLVPQIERLKKQIADLEAATPRLEVRVETATIEMVIAGAPAWRSVLDDNAGAVEGRRAIAEAMTLLIDRIWAVRLRRGVYRVETLYTEAGMQTLKYLAESERADWVESYYSAKALYQTTTS